jgi:hypothetical protein
MKASLIFVVTALLSAASPVHAQDAPARKNTYHSRVAAAKIPAFPAILPKLFR